MADPRDNPADILGQLARELSRDTGLPLAPDFEQRLAALRAICDNPTDKTTDKKDAPDA